MDIRSPRQLRDILRSNGINLALWKLPNAKRFRDLWNELVEGETMLEEAPLHRLTMVVTLIIRRENRILIEAEQELEGGYRRKRNIPPSEKMKPGESYLEAAYRCLAEEFGRPPETAQVLEATHRKTVRERPSPSYPGLLTRYELHSVDAVVEGLPDEPFWTEEGKLNPKDPVRRHLWIWQEPGDGDGALG